jgi:hypothetical protein
MKIPEHWSKYIFSQPETGMDYHTTCVTLLDGRIFEDVAIIHSSIIGEVRGYDSIPFAADEIADIKITHRKWSFRR